MNKKRKVTLYILFAVIATAANLSVQRIILSFNTTNLYFIFALFLGTLIGLLIKYFLDKNWIFFDNTRGLKSQSRKFSAYTIMGILTTIIYWVIYFNSFKKTCNGLFYRELHAYLIFELHEPRIQFAHLVP